MRSFLLLSYFLNYESMITHLQETWKILNELSSIYIYIKLQAIYSSAIYDNYF